MTELELELEPEPEAAADDAPLMSDPAEAAPDELPDDTAAAELPEPEAGVDAEDPVILDFRPRRSRRLKLLLWPCWISRTGT